MDRAFFECIKCQRRFLCLIVHKWIIWYQRMPLLIGLIFWHFFALSVNSYIENYKKSNMKLSFICQLGQKKVSILSFLLVFYIKFGATASSPHVFTFAGSVLILVGLDDWFFLGFFTSYWIWLSDWEKRNDQKSYKHYMDKKIVKAVKDIIKIFLCQYMKT